LCSSRKNPYPCHGRSSEIPRGKGVSRAEIIEANLYEAKQEFLGGKRGSKTKLLLWGSMDILSNCTSLLPFVHVAPNKETT